MLCSVYLTAHGHVINSLIRTKLKSYNNTSKTPHASDLNTQNKDNNNQNLRRRPDIKECKHIVFNRLFVNLRYFWTSKWAAV